MTENSCTLIYSKPDELLEIFIKYWKDIALFVVQFYPCEIVCQGQDFQFHISLEEAQTQLSPWALDHRNKTHHALHNKLRGISQSNTMLPVAGNLYS